MKGMDKSREYLQGAYDAASWIDGVLEGWGEVETRRKLEELTNNLLAAMEESFMDASGIEWPMADPRAESVNGPAVEGDGIDGSTPQA
jgi:hypothetical protein